MASGKNSLRLVLCAINPEGGSMANAMLSAALAQHRDLRERVEVHQLYYMVDEVRQPHYDITGIVAEILSHAPNVVGLSCWCWNHDLMVEIATILSGLKTDIRLIIGGGEIQPAAEELITPFPPHTWFVRGEGERPLQDMLLGWLDQGPESPLPAGVGRLVGGRVVWSDRPIAAIAGEEIPSPYEYGTLQLGGTEWMPGYASYRGCVFECSYCQWGDSHGIRTIPIERVLRELDYLGRQNYRHVWIVDTIFGQDWNRDACIIDTLAAWPERTQVSFETHPAFVTPKLVSNLARVNLRWIALGVQSLTPKALKASGRGRSVATIKRALELLYAGLPNPRCIHVDMIMGMPEDSIEAVISSMDQIKAHYPKVKFYASLLQVLPGTRLWCQARREGWICASPQRGHELISSPWLRFNETQTIKKLVLGIDFIQHHVSIGWQEALLKHYHLAFSQLAEIAGKVCAEQGMAWHTKDCREFFLDNQNRENPSLFPSLHGRIEEAVKRLSSAQVMVSCETEEGL